MNTQAHILINTVLLTRKHSKKYLYSAALWGALLPDLPIFVFFLVEGLRVGFGNPIIWRELYFSSRWTTVFAIFNSIPLSVCIVIGGYIVKQLTARVRTGVWLTIFGWSLFLHTISDLVLHHDDGHPHFFPFNDFIFSSPISYWDPAHYGTLVGSIETAISLLCTLLLLLRTKKRSMRIFLGLVALILIVLFVLPLLFDFF